MKVLKVLIVDDEILAIEYLKDMIPWHEYGYRIVGEATDARRALELFLTLRPHIIISDIYMPGINGLEFCSNILELDRSAKILLLTAYKEFEYAKRAIELGAVNYLLKHEINETMLLQVLGRIRDEIDREDSANSIIRKHAIMNFIDGNIDIYGLQNKWTSLEDDNGMFILVVLKEEMPYPIFGKTENKQINIEPQNVLTCLCKELPEEFNFVESIKLKNRHWALLFSCNSDISEGRMLSRFYSVAAKTQKLFERLAGGTFSVAVRAGQQKIENIAKLYNEALKVLEHTVFNKRGRIFNLNDSCAYKSNIDYKAELEKDLQSIAIKLENMELEEIEYSIVKLFEDIIKSNDTDLLHTGCGELLRLLISWCRDNFLEPIQIESPGIKSMLEKCHTANDIKNFFKYAFQIKQNELFDKNYKKYSPKVQNTVKYLYENFNKNISVVDAANVLEVSDSHLSRVFRNETGKTLLEYLTAIRIEKAKSLLNKHNYKVYEISEMVGYRTSQYFSQVFTKITGMNPLDYREREKKHDKK